MKIYEKWACDLWKYMKIETRYMKIQEKVEVRYMKIYEKQKYNI